MKLLTLALALLMPALPPSIFSQPAAPTPGAPGAIFSGAPTATPAAPGGVHVVPSAGGGRAQVMTLTITAQSSNSGFIAISPSVSVLAAVFGDGSYNAASITGILNTDSVSDIAAKIRSQIPAKPLISGGATWGDCFEITGTGAAVIFTFRVMADNVSTPIFFDPGTTSGTSATITETSAGQAGVAIPTPPAIFTAP